MDLHHRDALAIPVLETERLVLREVRVSDAEDILSFVGDPEFEKWNGGGVDSLETLAREIGRSAHDANGEWTVLRCGITLKPGDTVIGGVSLHNWSKEHNRAELGYEVSRPYWRQGIASEAVRAVLRFAFEELRLHRVEAFPTMDNLASVRLLERLGFTREGTARDVLLMDDGLYHSVGQFSMPDSEYQPE